MWLLYTFVHLIWQLSLFFAVMLQIILRVISLGKCSWYNWILYQQCFSCFFIRATHFAFLCSTVFLFVRLFVCFKVNCHWICIFKSLCFILLSSFSPFSFCLFYSFTLLRSHSLLLSLFCSLDTRLTRSHWKARKSNDTHKCNEKRWFYSIQNYWCGCLRGFVWKHT